MTIEQMRMLEPTEGEVWERARKDYEAGVAVGEICGRYGLARATVYQRAQVWRAAGGAIDLDAPAPKAAALAEIAWRRMAMAVEAGRIQEVLCWRSVTETLEKRAAKEAWALKIKGMSLNEAADALIDACDKVVADEKPMQAASLDTPLPCSDAQERVASYSAEAVRDWRAWAAYSERFTWQEPEDAHADEGEPVVPLVSALGGRTGAPDP